MSMSEEEWDDLLRRAEAVYEDRIAKAIQEAADAPFHRDSGKPRLDIIPPDFLFEVGRVFEYGDNKYPGPRNWEQYADQWKWGQLYASALRHLLAWAAREDYDTESGLPHLAHAAANLAMLMSLIQAGKGTDDRSTLGRRDALESL